MAPPWRRVEEMPRPSIDMVVVFDSVYPHHWLTGYLTAMRIVVNKLSSNDRLSAVLLQTHPHRLMELTFMTDQGKTDALDLLTIKDNFVIDYSITNVATGLREGAQILRGREAEEGHIGVGCILLLSSLMTPIPTQHEISPEFPVHTFGVHYNSHNPESMKYIADQTSATYSLFGDLQDVKHGMELFMASILRVAATSIRITIRAHDSITISSIESGSYNNSVRPDKLSGEIEIRDIYAGEQKNFIVYLTVAESKNKLVTIGGQYRSLNMMSKQLPDTDVFVLRPRSGCSPAKLSVHHDVAAELARIRLMKGLSALVEPGKRLYIMHMENLWDSVRLPKDGQGPPEETLSRLRRYVDEMKKLVCRTGVNPKQVPYLMSWLSCHQWQRATTKGSYYYDSGAFTLAQPGDADEEDDN